MASDDEIEDLDCMVMDVGDLSSVDGKKIKRSPKTTSLQYHKLQEFMQTHTDFTKGKADDSQLLAWEELSDDLNKIGPPFHTSIDWRRVWTDYKANQKKKGNPAVIVNDALRLAMTGRSKDKQPEDISDSLSGIFDKIEIVEDKIEKVEVKMDTLIEQNKETNCLLKEMINLLKPQSLTEEDDI